MLWVDTAYTQTNEDMFVDFSRGVLDLTGDKSDNFSVKNNNNCIMILEKKSRLRGLASRYLCN